MNNQDLRSLLADRAESVDTHRPDRVDEVHSRIRTAGRRRTAAVVGAAAVVVALALAAVTLPDSGTKTQDPVDRPTDGISTLRPETNPEIQDRLTSDNPEGLLDPGTYAIEVDDLRPLPVLDLPRGYRSKPTPSWPLSSGLRGVTAPSAPWPVGGHARTFRAWRRTRDRLLERGEDHGRPRQAVRGASPEFKRPGPSVENLATALADLPGFRATAPAPVSLGGYDGLYVELVINAPRCPLFWITGPTSKDPYTDNDAVLGHVERLWILDVEGGRIVVEATNQPGATEEQIAELTRIVESVRFSDTE